MPKPSRLLRVFAVWLIAAIAALAACTVAPEPEQQAVLVYPPPPDPPRYYYERTLFGSLDVVEETGADRLRRFATGESERGKGFGKPFDVLALEGRIFVSDTVARRVSVLDFPRKRFYDIGTEGIGRLAKPLGLAADGAGHLYVVDGTAKRVQVYDLEGNYVTSMGDETIFVRPSGIAVSVDGTRVYVVDTGGVGSQDHVVHIFDADGNNIGKIGARGTETGQFNLPLMATVGPDGNLHVVDAGNFRVQVFGPDGGFLRAFGEAGRFPGQFSHPKGIAVDREGKIFVADSGFANFQIFDSDGQILMFIGQRSDAGGPGEYLLPAGISVDVDGRVYMVDQFFRKIEVFRPAGLPAEAPIGQSPDAESTS